MKKTTSYLMAFVALFASCGDFLEERSQNMAYVEVVEDLDELLIGECYLKGGYSLDSADADKNFYWTKPVAGGKFYFPYPHLMDDDITEYVLGPIAISLEKNYTRLKAQKVYTWQADPFVDAEMNTIEDENWRDTYKRIAALNAIIACAREMRPNELDPTTVDRVEGEALFLRAQYYFWLANFYGAPYCKATSGAEGCVPLKVSEAVEDRYFERSTCKEVYDQMVADLQLSADLLRGKRQTTKYRTCQAAAFALLSRVCLYMEDYVKAVEYADSVMRSDYDLVDLNKYRVGEDAVYASSTETIFTHGANIMAVLHAPAVKYGLNFISSGYSSSDDLMAAYDSTDLRRKAFFIDRSLTNGTGYRCVKMRFKAEEVSDLFAIRLPEVYLNKAEALAQLGRDEEARRTLDELRANRFAAADLKPVNATGKELVGFVRDERRRELCFEGHRWFDLRRYAVNTECPYSKTIRHTVLGNDNGNIFTEAVYELKPYNEDKAAYQMPIPYYAIDFNMGLLKNPVRGTRQPIMVGNGE
ncbi:MAG: RagB/SusD family nutrient uptake outer membrane protein [Prevotella sp.]